MLKNTDIGYSSLTERVFMWKAKTVKWFKEWVKQFIWDKIDITSKFLHIVDQYFEIGTSRVITWWKEDSLFIHIANTKKAKEWLIKTLQKDLSNNTKQWHSTN